jgi:thioredoxin-like negative regulator of GroEL
MKPKGGHRSRALAGLAAVGLLALLSPPLLADSPQPSASAERIAEGRSLHAAGKYKEAVRAFKEADKLANGACAECHLRLAASFNKLGAYQEALKNVDSALGMTTDKNILLGAYYERGVAFAGRAANDPKQLEPAEKAFRQVLEMSDGQINSVRFNLGVTLLQMSRDAEGVALLKEYLARDPGAEEAEAARKLVANPLRARKQMVPDFELTTLAGDYLTAEEMRGKVLLLDFWGTWCPPCVAAVPSLRSLSQRMKDEPLFRLVSISTDSDEKTVRAFIAKNRMDWPQVWDKGQELTHECNVHSFPTYVLISPEGEIIHVVGGWGPGIERDLNKQIQAAVRGARSRRDQVK